MEENNGPKISGFDIFELKISHGNWLELTINNEENFFMIFLKAFPELAKEFFLGNEFWIYTNNNHLTFLEKELLKRLPEAHEKSKIKMKDWPKEKLLMLKNGMRITRHHFLGREYEINTFGQHEHRVTLSLLSFYDLLRETKGLKVVPVPEFSDK